MKTKADIQGFLDVHKVCKDYTHEQYWNYVQENVAHLVKKAKVCYSGADQCWKQYKAAWL